MSDRPPVCCICGSTKFKEDFTRINAEMTLRGIIVVTVGFFAHADQHEITRHEKAVLDALHMAKIDLADFVYVVNRDGYVGESTEREIAYARQRGKPVLYFNDDDLPTIQRLVVPGGSFNDVRRSMNEWRSLYNLGDAVFSQSDPRHLTPTRLP